MALSAQDMGNMARLAQLAVNPQGAGRDEIYVAVASLYRAQGARLSERERGLMREILSRLSNDVEMAVRIALAERLADDDEAPLDLILVLCDDRIEVARPIILRSRNLTDEEILKFVADASALHQTAVASRPNIGEAVTDYLAKSEFETVLVALVRNVTARIGATTFETLVQKSRRLESLHSPLAHRADLPMQLATQMCEWVSDALKEHITTNFNAAALKVETALPRAAQSVRWEPLASAEPSEGPRKLVDKLFIAGQLKAGFLLRVLHQGQIELFDMAFARLLGIDVASFRTAFYERGPRAVALACRSVGIDRSVFATVFQLSRKARGVAAQISPEQRSEVDGIFNAYSKDDAMVVIRSTRLAAAG